MDEVWPSWRFWAFLAAKSFSYFFFLDLVSRLDVLLPDRTTVPDAELWLSEELEEEADEAVEKLIS